MRARLIMKITKRRSVVAAVLALGVAGVSQIAQGATQPVSETTVGQEELGTVSVYTVTLSKSGTAATVASLRPSSTSLHYGRIFGHVVGRGVVHLHVVLSAVGHGVPLEGHVVDRTTVSKSRTFTIKDITPGLYGIGVRRGGCKGKEIHVKAERTTKVTLVCE